MSNEQWSVLQLMLPEPKWQPGGPGRPPLDLRRVVDGIFYVNKTGCQWRLMPHDFGKGMTLYGYFRRWRQQGVWADLMDILRIWERRDQGRKDDPSAGCPDSQSIKVTTQHQEVGPDRIAAPDDQTTASYPQENGEKLDLEADNRLNLDWLQRFA